MQILICIIPFSLKMKIYVYIWFLINLVTDSLFSQFQLNNNNNNNKKKIENHLF